VLEPTTCACQALAKKTLKALDTPTTDLSGNTLFREPPRLAIPVRQLRPLFGIFQGLIIRRIQVEARGGIKLTQLVLFHIFTRPDLVTPAMTNGVHIQAGRVMDTE
jgi:hypothetical protein